MNKKQKLQNRYRLLNFQQNIKQVYNWLENHGEVFLKRNQSIGKNLMRAKMLHLSHENFVKVLKVRSAIQIVNGGLEKKNKPKR